MRFVMEFTVQGWRKNYNGIDFNDLCRAKLDQYIDDEIDKMPALLFILDVPHYENGVM